MLSRLVILIVLVLALLMTGFCIYNQEGSICAVCDRPMHRATSYFLRLDSSELVEVCCPRCGLRYRKGRNDILEEQAADYSTGGIIEAKSATYVEGSAVHLCCEMPPVQKDQEGNQYDLVWDRCMPSVIAFGSRESALAFQSQHGGELRTYSGLLLESHGWE